MTIVILYVDDIREMAGELLLMKVIEKGACMEVAFAFLEDRIAPVFDTTQRILLAEVKGLSIRTETVARLTEQEPLERAKALAGLGVDVLVCGAISADLQRSLASLGIRVIPFVAGDLREIMQAWLQDRLALGAYRMPGCRRRGPFAQEEVDMNKTGRAGGRCGSEGEGRKRGVGSHQSSRVDPGRRDGRGQADLCLCPKCGHREPHDQTTPCNQKLCPECGTAMTREYPLF